MELPYLVPALEEFRREETHHIHIVAPNLNPNTNPCHAPDPNLRPVISTAFKREARKKRRERKRQRKLEEKLEGELQSLLALETQTHQSVPSSISNIEWPCNDIGPDPNPEPAGWAVPDLNPQPPPPHPFGEEQGRIASLQVQQNVLTQCQEFFAANDCSDDEQADDDDDDDDDDDESANLKFFVELFEKDGDLRGLYEKNCEKGEFCCLVCGAIGEKSGKRYGNCVGLVQHANTVSKTKKREAHRDFGRAVCRVLGWDIDKLPGIFDEQSLATGADLQKQMGILDEAGLHKGVTGAAGSGKGELMDYMEADTDTD